LWGGAVFAQRPAAGPSAAAAPRGIGPFSIQTSRGVIQARLLRRDRDLVWVAQQLSSGQTVDTGLPARDIVKFNLARPRLFQAAEGADPAQVAALRPQLENYIRLLTPYRDLTGLNVDEAQLLLGGLLERNQDWAGAAALYADILSQSYRPAEQAEAGLRRGLCLARLDRHEEALPLLVTTGLNDRDDMNLVSEVYRARGAALQKLGRHEEAILTWLHLVVFLPYVNDNEPQALAAVLPSYAALNDWDAAYKTVRQVEEKYTNHPAALAAADFARTYAEQLNKEAAFRGDAEEAIAPEEEENHEDTE
jgi:tetratricopeptide (TPR) repeat protein